MTVTATLGFSPDNDHSRPDADHEIVANEDVRPHDV